MSIIKQIHLSKGAYGCSIIEDIRITIAEGGQSAPHSNNTPSSSNYINKTIKYITILIVSSYEGFLAVTRIKTPVKKFVYIHIINANCLNKTGTTKYVE